MRGPSTTPASTASRSDGPMENKVSGSQNPVTPANSSFCRFWAAINAARVWSRWKNSSSLDCTSSNVQWTWASMSPGMTVQPAASMTVAPN